MRDNEGNFRELARLNSNYHIYHNVHWSCTRLRCQCFSSHLFFLCACTAIVLSRRGALNSNTHAEQAASMLVSWTYFIACSSVPWCISNTTHTGSVNASHTFFCLRTQLLCCCAAVPKWNLGIYVSYLSYVCMYVCMYLTILRKIDVPAKTSVLPKPGPTNCKVPLSVGPTNCSTTVAYLTSDVGQQNPPTPTAMHALGMLAI